MANTTDMLITTFGDEKAIEVICDKTGLEFKLISDNDKCGGTKTVSFDVWACCYRCIGSEKIKQLIKAFEEAEYLFPEFAVLLIDCDDLEEFSKSYTVEN